MSRLLRALALTLLPMLFLSLRAAEAPPPVEQPAPEAEETPAAAPAPEESEAPPLEPISADNNLTFPVDI